MFAGLLSLRLPSPNDKSDGSTELHKLKLELRHKCHNECCLSLSWLRVVLWPNSATFKFRCLELAKEVEKFGAWPSSGRDAECHLASWAI